MSFDACIRRALKDKATVVPALVGLAVCAALIVPSAHAQTIDASDRGAYLQDGRFGFPLLNYTANGGSDLGEVRNWLVFNIPALTPGLVYGTAILRLNTRNIFTPFPTETYELHDVTTPIATLENGTGGVAAFNDLGDGPVFGSRVYGAGEDNMVLDIALTSSAVSAINANAGSLFATGGSLTTLRGQFEAVFGNSNDVPLSQTQLILTTITAAAAPEPGTLGLLGIGLPVGIGMMRRRRAGNGK